MPTNVGIYIKLNIILEAIKMNKNLNKRGIPKPKEVDPIKKLKDIEKIKQYLKGKENRRDYMLFVVGINIGLRAGDLLELKIKDVLSGKNFNDSVLIKEQKTGKMREFSLNKSAKDAIQYYLENTTEYDSDDYLFKSRKGGRLTVQAAHKIIKGLLRELNIKGNYGTHSLRKTWAYHVYINNAKNNPMILPTLQKMLNHSNQATTLRYIGITKEVISDVYNSNNL
jgi:integrase